MSLFARARADQARTYKANDAARYTQIQAEKRAAAQKAAQKPQGEVYGPQPEQYGPFPEDFKPGGKYYDDSNDTASESYLEWGVIVVAGAAAIKGGAAVIAQIGASLAPAVPTAADYANKAAQQINNFSVSAKHLANAGGSYAKFATNDASVVNNWISNALSRASEFVVNSSDSYYTIVEYGKAIGTKGETAIKIVFTKAGDIITAYPVK